MAVVTVIISFIVCLSTAVADYPMNPRLVSQSYREITVRWDNITNFNASGDATQGPIYAIDIKLKNLPQYFVKSSMLVITPNEPLVTISNLLIGSTVTLKVGLKKHADRNPAEYSPWVDWKTKSSADVNVPVLPGPPRDITICRQQNTTGMVALKICWKTPANVAASSDENVTSIQYLISTCYYNPLISKNYNCKDLTEVVGNTSQLEQSTVHANALYTSNLNVVNNREVAIRVQSVALNGKLGNISQITKRFNESTAPKSPSNLRNGTVYHDTIQVMWNKVIGATAYRIKYNAEGSSSSLTVTTANSKYTITNLTPFTKYEIRVAVDESNNGQSAYSSALDITTNNATQPTQAPKTTPKSAGVILSPYINVVFALSCILMFFGCK